jgi:hypothetical protein
MPFTFSHPAVVIPLIKARTRLSSTALIIGSIIPDFEYFIRMRDTSYYSHTIAGLFWFDIPLALIVCFIYHLLVRNSLFDNLPRFLKERFSIYKRFDWINYFKRNWVIVFFSIIIGAATHIIWDGIIHETMFYARQADLTNMLKIGRVNLAGYKFLQLASTIIGGLIVIYSIFALKRIPQPKSKIDFRYWTLFWFITLSLLFLRFAKGNYQFYSWNPYRPVIVSFISCMMIALIVTPLVSKRNQQANIKSSSKKKIKADSVGGNY